MEWVEAPRGRWSLPVSAMAGNTDRSWTNRLLSEPLTAFGWRRAVFTLVVLAFFGLVAAFGLWRDLVFVFIGWFDVSLELFAEDFEAVAPHRLHIFVFGLMLWTAAVGMLAQIRAPRRNVAGQWMALLPWVAFLVALVASDFLEPLPIIVIFGGVTLVATVLHPAGGSLIGSFEAARVSRVLLVLAIVAAVPLLAYAATQIGLQTGAIDPAHDHGGAAHDHGGASHDHERAQQEHVEGGHYAGSAAFGFLVIGVGLLASLRPQGWWLPAWIAGLMAVIFGLASIAFPDPASTVGPLWAGAAILWGLGFIAVAELTQDEETPTLLGRRATSGGSAAR